MKIDERTVIIKADIMLKKNGLGLQLSKDFIFPSENLCLQMSMRLWCFAHKFDKFKLGWAGLGKLSHELIFSS